MKGRKPTPTKILEARDSWHAKTAARRSEPKPKMGKPKCPTWLKGRARSMWKKISGDLFDLGVLSLNDENTLVRYCQLWARWRKCEEFIEKNGESFQTESRNGELSYRLYPESRVAQALAAELRKLETEFGLTPSSRSRIVIDESNKGERVKDKARFFEQVG